MQYIAVFDTSIWQNKKRQDFFEAWSNPKQKREQRYGKPLYVKSAGGGLEAYPPPPFKKCKIGFYLLPRCNPTPPPPPM